MMTKAELETAPRASRNDAEAFADDAMLLQGIRVR